MSTKLYLPKHLVQVSCKEMRDYCPSGSRVWFRDKRDKELRTGFFNIMTKPPMSMANSSVVDMYGDFFILKNATDRYDLFLDVERIRPHNRDKVRGIRNGLVRKARDIERGKY